MGSDAESRGGSPSHYKRKRDSASPSRPKPRQEDYDELPQPYNARSLQPAKRRALSPSAQPPRQKRPGRRAQISGAEREAIRQRQLEREREAAAAEAAEAERLRHRGINDVVKEHYNNVPERGRDWRKTDSKIRGLRSFNNWVKSCIIQRFSPDDDATAGPGSSKRLLVLDIGCGKGGDLQKWQQAPQGVELYVGLDPADVSIDQARERYRQMASRGGRGGHRGRPPPRLFDGRFLVKDCFGESIADVDIVRQVGFDPSPMNKDGFDVVSMMFCMHYAFESEEKARTMLKNVAGALTKGGRFLGCIPNSDVLSERVRRFNAENPAKKKQGDQPDAAAVEAKAKEDGEEKEEGEAEEEEEGEVERGAEWGNTIYRVRFPGPTPEDGVFRPAYGWKYSYFLDEAVEGVPEYVVPWEAFRALAEDYNLELQYHKTFTDVWETEKNDRDLGPLSERMGVRERGGGDLLVSPEEMEAAAFYVAFCFYKV
ncbi:related to RNA (guanine-N7-) methyltransferase [Cephalotrichum gorgonifer]|uniref:mRNA cap guanine-N(7) methyltransferase n=1 Tax=Cephalotrichum gorgonifer TaxID=2041049 RepID=A0AAE8N4V7_9PEZI|nr:related to RNA (guanine-N7-) methyltransferase [Cephalotrichum gorgonifer]